MSEIRIMPVICEAKAYASPVAMPDWLKSTRHVRILMLPNVNQPWDEAHPDPLIELEPLDELPEDDEAQ